jgi:hypothetical protein
MTSACYLEKSQQLLNQQQEVFQQENEETLLNQQQPSTNMVDLTNVPFIVMQNYEYQDIFENDLKFQEYFITPSTDSPFDDLGSDTVIFEKIDVSSEISNKSPNSNDEEVGEV